MRQRALLFGILFTGFIELSLAGLCPESWEEEHRGGLKIRCCHIPESVTDRYGYCQGLKAEFGNDHGLKLCFVPVERRQRRSGLLFGGSPPPPPTPPPGK